MNSPSFPNLSLSDIRNAIPKQCRNKIDEILIHQSVGSTNDELWQRLQQGKTNPAVCLSESQTAGRGRQGDQWQSPNSGNLYLSISWAFPADMPQSGLSIAIGISLINLLKSEGINDLQLKWPNDILHNRAKLAGILVESRFGNQLQTVIGIGLNFKLPTAAKNKIQQTTTSLQQLCTQIPCRNELAGKIIHTMINTLENFQSHGLQDFIPHWANYDALANQSINLISDDSPPLNVTAEGINQQGELLYRHNGQLHTLSNSHISIRFAS